jgi:hypothetical protein
MWQGVFHLSQSFSSSFGGIVPQLLLRDLNGSSN